MSRKNKDKRYRQCHMERKTDTAVVHTTSYIPEKYAKVGHILELNTNDEWVDGWVVKSIGELVEDPPDPRALIKGHRKMTGDSLKRSH